MHLDVHDRVPMYVIYYTIYVRTLTWFLQDRTNNLSRQAIAKRNVADDNIRI